MSKKAMPWKTLSSKTILNNRRLKVTEDVVLLPDGTKTTYVRHAPATAHSVIIIAINVKNQILVQREYSYPPNKIMWQLPGGSIKLGESIRSAAKRELAEESGFSSKRTKILGSFYIHNRLSNKKQYVVVCTKLFEHKLRGDVDEFIDTHWLSKRQLTGMIAKGEFNNINLLAALNIWFNRKETKL